jgi:2-polyprenyl-3-methyl-5-hydroxy-6-metoxy-1,4-benzoquinol methylase
MVVIGRRVDPDGGTHRKTASTMAGSAAAGAHFARLVRQGRRRPRHNPRSDFVGEGGRLMQSTLPSRSVSFFDEHIRRPPDDEVPKLNPFEEPALPYLRGDVLDFGCGLGNLAFAAARRGCRVRFVSDLAAASMTGKQPRTGLRPEPVR